MWQNEKKDENRMIIKGEVKEQITRVRDYF